MIGSGKAHGTGQALVDQPVAAVKALELIPAAENAAGLERIFLQCGSFAVPLCPALHIGKQLDKGIAKVAGSFRVVDIIVHTAVQQQGQQVAGGVCVDGKGGVRVSVHPRAQL